MDAHQMRNHRERSFIHITLMVKLLPDLVPRGRDIRLGLQPTKKRTQVDGDPVAGLQRFPSSVVEAEHVSFGQRSRVQRLRASTVS